VQGKGSAILGTLLLTVSALAAVGAGGDSPWTHRDSWYTGFPEGESPFQSWAPVSPDRYFPVDTDASAEAEGLLRDVSFALVSAEQASRFGSARASSPVGRQPYLLRGVLLNEQTGGFSLYSSGNRLLVSHDSLGQSPLPMRRRPLVAYLSEPPSELFVVCGIDE